MSEPLSPLLRILQILVQGFGVETLTIEGYESIPPEFRVVSGPVVFKFVLEDERWVKIHLDFVPNKCTIGDLTLANVVELLTAAKKIHDALILQCQVVGIYINFGWELFVFDSAESYGVSYAVLVEVIKKRLVTYLQF